MQPRPKKHATLIFGKHLFETKGSQVHARPYVHLHEAHMIFWWAIVLKGDATATQQKHSLYFQEKFARGTQLAKQAWCLVRHGSEALNGPPVAWANSYTLPHTFSTRSAYVTEQVRQS